MREYRIQVIYYQCYWDSIKYSLVCPHNSKQIINDNHMHIKISIPCGKLQ